MAQKRFIVFYKDGTTEHITADFGDEDDEPDGYVFFVDWKIGIVGLFAKGLIHSWCEDVGGPVDEPST